MELIWADVYERAVELFGDQTPGTELEASIVALFEAQPAAVVAAIDKLGRRFTAGRVHSPWPLVLREVGEAPARDQIRASDDSERERARVKAERFIRQVGYICETEQELRAELAERKWPVDDRLIDLWRELRPIGEQLERDAVERAEHWKQTRKAMQRIGKLSTSATESDKTLHTSQTWMPLTRVSAAADPDDDIPWP